jgi:gluconolactonase
MNVLTAKTELVAARLPVPTELLPGRPDAVVDLQTEEGVALVGGTWRYSDAAVSEIAFVDVGSDDDPLGPGDIPNRTYDIAPHAQSPDFDDSGWRVLSPEETMLRLGNGRVSFNWYRIEVTVPERIGNLDPTGSTAVFEVQVDDYAEIWVNGELPLALGTTGGQVVGGFNVPNRVLLSQDVQPGERFQISVFGINGPISASPANYIWMRSATLDFYSAERARTAELAELRVDRVATRIDEIVPEDAILERVAGGFEFTEGPVWTRDGALLFSSPNTNVVYRWTPAGTVDVFRTKSGYAGVDIGRFFQPGSNGLTFSPEGLLTICQHGNRRVIRVNPHGDITVLADSYRGRRLNSPNDLVYRSDGTLYFTDPPFGLPEQFDDPAKELPFSGVFRVRDGEVELVSDALEGPNGIAFSPDERFVYVGNWDPERKIVVRYEVDEAGDLSEGEIFHDMTGADDLTGDDGEDAIDGIKVDTAGNVYACGPGGIWVLSPDGDHLGTLALPEAPHNLAWGDHDGRALYVTAETSVYRIRLNIPGIRPV